MSVSLEPLFDLTFRAIFASANRWHLVHFGNYDIRVIELYWIPHPIAHGSSIDPPSIAMLRELRASSVGAVHLRRSRVERRARVKGISSVDYYRARCKATHMRSKSFSNVVKRRQEEDDERGDQRKTTTKREREAKGSPLGNQPPHWTVGGLTH